MSGQIDLGRISHRGIIAVASALVWGCGFASLARADEASVAVAKPTAAAGSERAAGTSPQAASQRQRVDQLIHDLGSPRYPARRSAANELRQIGAEAFDALHAATENSDPEIAASANYLLRQISVHWVQPEDPPTVRAVLRQYGQEADGIRLQRIEQLARLPQGAGIPGLCRITRYDRSPLISRTAALAVIRPKDAAADRARIDPTVVNEELGSSTRAGAVWLRRYLVQLGDPPASIAAWKPLIEQESARLETNSTETSNEILLGLYWNLADVYRQTNDQSSLTSTLDRMLELAADGSDEAIINLLVWLTENKSWDALDSFLAKHQSRLEQSKRPMYYAALARVKQGKQEAAEQLAKSASEIQAPGSLEGFITAKDLEEHGQFDWAVREYRRAIDKQPSDGTETILARIYLSGLLHDYAREKEAADTLEPLVKAVQGESRIAQRYAQIREYQNGRLALPDPDAIAANYHFYRAEQYTAEKDYTRARGELDLAINFDPTNADVLISMYRVPEADEKWRGGVRQRLRKLTDQFQEEIEQDPADASPYNQWAWLVSNTEGDFQKAVRYSHRSLELNTNGESGAASYLDTLARCYYAAGDYENAVKYERLAIQKNSFMQVMQRQLALFEKALADKNAAAKAPAESPK
jgi:tetratricopeptide (TPR) repeat protein